MSHKDAKRKRQETKSILRGGLSDVLVAFRRAYAARLPQQARWADEVSTCDSCAFRPQSGIPREFEQTVLAFAFALAGRQNFYCHESFPVDAEGKRQEPTDPSDLRVCGAYYSLAWLNPVMKLADIVPEPFATGLVSFAAHLQRGRLAKLDQGVIGSAAEELTSEDRDAVKEARRAAPRAGAVRPDRARLSSLRRPGGASGPRGSGLPPLRP